MFVENIMNKDVVSVSEQMNLNKMLELVHQHKFEHLPVVKTDNTLVGMVSIYDIQKASPSTISSLSVGEINYLQSSVTAKKIMTTGMITCSAKTLIENAGQLLHDNKISSLPVVKKGKLIGIITTKDILAFFLDITGCKLENTTRIAIKVSDKKGALSDFLHKMAQKRAYVASVVSPMEIDKNGKRVCIVRFYAQNPHKVDEFLKESGYEILTENFTDNDNDNDDGNDNGDVNIAPVVDKKDINLKQLVEKIEKTDQLFINMGMQIEKVDYGRCTVNMPVTANMLNSIGLIHGGATFSLADVALALAANSHAIPAVSLSSSIYYPASAKLGDTLTATAIEKTLGKSTATYQVEVKRSDGVLTALFTGNVFRKKDMGVLK